MVGGAGIRPWLNYTLEMSGGNLSYAIRMRESYGRELMLLVQPALKFFCLFRALTTYHKRSLEALGGQYIVARSLDDVLPIFGRPKWKMRGGHRSNGERVDGGAA